MSSACECFKAHSEDLINHQWPTHKSVHLYPRRVSQDKEMQSCAANQVGDDSLVSTTQATGIFRMSTHLCQEPCEEKLRILDSDCGRPSFRNQVPEQWADWWSNSSAAHTINLDQSLPVYLVSEDHKISNYAGPVPYNRLPGDQTPIYLFCAKSHR